VFESENGVVRLIGSTCQGCGVVAFPARVVCLECGAAHERTLLSGAGTVHGTTVVATPPEGFPEDGFTYLAVDLNEGPRVLGAAADDAHPEPGDQVQAVLGTVRGGEPGFRFEVSDA
jgi:uncharacterized OB-fold protein